MTHRLSLAAIVTLALAHPAAAQPAAATGVAMPVTTCTAANAGIESVVPGAAEQRSVLGSAVTLYHLDRQAAVSVSHTIAVVYDRGVDAGGRACVLVGGPHDGFFRVDLANATETSVDRRGVATVTIGVTHYSPDGKHTPGSIALVIDSRAPRITARVR
jgi:hypothetical protein